MLGRSAMSRDKQGPSTKKTKEWRKVHFEVFFYPYAESRSDKIGKVHMVMSVLHGRKQAEIASDSCGFFFVFLSPDYSLLLIRAKQNGIFSYSEFRNYWF